MLEWLDYGMRGDKEFVDPDMMKEGGFDSLDIGEGNL